MEHISTFTVANSSTFYIEFTNIPQSYDHLVGIQSIRSLGGNFGGYMFFFNATTGSDYVQVAIDQTGSGNVLYRADTIDQWLHPIANDPANDFTSDGWIIPNYTGTSNKSLMSYNSGRRNASGRQKFAFTRQQGSNTSAITSIAIGHNPDYLEPGSTVSIYGMKNT